MPAASDNAFGDRSPDPLHLTRDGEAAVDAQEWNAQTKRLQASIDQEIPLATRRGTVLGQLIFCEGCCCGQVERGFPPFPRERIKTAWKSLGLNSTIQLTISGCLGPCDLANVFCFVSAGGLPRWFGGLIDLAEYEQLIDWAVSCRESQCILPFPRGFERHRFPRFSATPHAGNGAP